MISVVIPLYNKEKCVASTLRTVLNQTFTDYEIVIVNDGSTDNSVAEVEKVQDDRIRLIHQQNAGVSVARNRGIKEAKGDLIAFLDADDEWKPEYLTTQYHLSQKYPECSVFACNYEFCSAEGKVTPTIIHKLSLAGEDGILINYFEVASCSHSPLWTSAVMVKKQALLSVGGFPVGIKSGEDLLTWARLAYRYKIAFSRKVCACYCLPDKLGNRSRDSHIKDIKQVPDYIGGEIESYYKRSSGKLKKDIRKYLSFWYKMRASINFSLGYRYPAFLCSCRSLYYNPCNWKVYLFFFLVIMPYPVIKQILSRYRK